MYTAQCFLCTLSVVSVLTFCRLCPFPSSLWLAGIPGPVPCSASSSRLVYDTTLLSGKIELIYFVVFVNISTCVCGAADHWAMPDANSKLGGSGFATVFLGSLGVGGFGDH